MISSETQTATEGLGKGKAFFERARTVAETGNYDYAIDLYIEGLLREPLNIKEHEALRDVALRRKIKGGKPAGGIFGVRPYFKGKTSKEQMLNTEWLLAKDPGNISTMQTMLKQAAAADYRDVVLWLGPIFLQANRTTKNPNPRLYLEIADLYEKFEAFAKAGEAIGLAQQLTPADASLDERIKALAAQETLKKGQYESVSDFKESLRDKEMTKDLLQKESLSKTLDYKKKMVEDARAAYESAPTDQQTIAKYVKTLLDMETEEYENMAIQTLQKAYEATKVYRYKTYIGDVRLKQYRRHARILIDAVKTHPDDPSLEQELHKLEEESLQFELQEFEERARHYPSDGVVMYKYGHCLYRAKRFDEAIAALQQAQNNPQHRSDSLYLLGRAFLEQTMNQEAVETLQRAIEDYELAATGDTKSKEMHYWLARAMEATQQSDEAAKIYSQIAQWDISFRDARQRLADLRKRKS